MINKSNCAFGNDMITVKNRVNRAVITVCNSECKEGCKYFVQYIKTTPPEATQTGKRTYYPNQL